MLITSMHHPTVCLTATQQRASGAQRLAEHFRTMELSSGPSIGRYQRAFAVTAVLLIVLNFELEVAHGVGFLFLTPFR